MPGSTRCFTADGAVALRSAPTICTSPVSAVLPADLLEAEQRTFDALTETLDSQRRGRWQVTWRFEGLRLLGPALRLANSLRDSGRSLLLAWPDAGAAALAKRDGQELADCCVDLMQLQRDPAWAQRGDLLLIVGAQPSDYETVEAICTQWMEPVVLINSRLEDAAVGIGGVARSRRRGFMSTWKSAYHLEPFLEGALMQERLKEWDLFRLDPDGHRWVKRFEERPDQEQIDEALAGSADGLKQTLGAMDRFIGDLSG